MLQLANPFKIIEVLQALFFSAQNQLHNNIVGLEELATDLNLTKHFMMNWIKIMSQVFSSNISTSAHKCSFFPKSPPIHTPKSLGNHSQAVKATKGGGRGGEWVWNGLSNNLV